MIMCNSDTLEGNMNSPKKINYEIRPCKYVERKMMLETLSQIKCNTNTDYQYIGLGGLAFTDFKLFHKELGINKLFSIEGGLPIGRLELNRPYSFIRIVNEMSYEALQKIDLSKPSIVWLDYDNELQPDAFKDMTLLFNQLPSNSVYIVTCNRDLKVENQKMTKKDLIDRFEGLVPPDLKNDCCSDVKICETLRRMIKDYCLSILEKRNKREGTQLKFVQLFNIKYQENLGAKMFTYGGIILNNDVDEGTIITGIIDDLRSDETYEIDVPILTHKEILYLDSIFDNTAEEERLNQYQIISKSLIEKYKRIHRYMPNFFDVRV